MSICTADDIINLKKYLGLSQTDTSRDEVLERLLDVAFETAQSVIGWTLNRELTDTIVIEGRGQSMIAPPAPYYPIVSISSLKIANVDIPAAVKTDWSSCGWYLQNNIIYLRGYRAIGEICLTITYGAKPTDMPQELLQAVYELAAIKNKASQHLGLATKVGLSKETETYFPDDVTPTILSTLKRYTKRDEI